MNMKIGILLAVLLVSAVFAAPAWRRVEPARALPLGWVPVHDEAASGMAHLVFGVTRRNTAELSRILAKVSDPQHAEYGHYLTQGEVEALVRPDPAVLARLQQWVREAGATHIMVSGYQDQLVVDMPVEKASALLNTKFVTLKHLASGRKVARSVASYYVPEEFGEHIDYVTGVHSLPLITAKRPAAPGDNSEFGPTALRTRYNVQSLGGKSANNSMAVAEFQGQFYAPTDLKSFFAKYVPYAPEANVSRVVGQNMPGDPGIEASLDIEYILGVAPKVRAEFWSQTPMDFWSDLTTWVGLIQKDPAAPWVHSVSYGSQSSYPSTSFRDRLNSDFESLGARGISIIFASGDSGTGCFLCAEFVDSVPATLPSVTSVGATTFQTGTSGTEIAVTAFGSGGGFSSHFARPSYQSAAVQKYLGSGVKLPESFFYHASGRANPDVSALGWGFAVINDGVTQSIGGTSAAAPTFAGIIALLNDERLAAGKPTLGFLNPWIYQTAAANPNAFNDVTVGDNQDGCCVEGFNCAAGWDPVTGVGTPNMAELLKHI